MTAQPPARLSLELEPASEPITGLLRDERGEARQFSGWLGLMDAVETARAAQEGPARSKQEGNSEGGEEIHE